MTLVLAPNSSGCISIDVLKHLTMETLSLGRLRYSDEEKRDLLDAIGVPSHEQNYCLTILGSHLREMELLYERLTSTHILQVHPGYIHSVAETIRRLRHNLDERWAEAAGKCWPGGAYVPSMGMSLDGFIILALFSWLQLSHEPEKDIFRGINMGIECTFDPEMTVRENITACLRTGGPLAGGTTEMDVNFTAANLVYFYNVEIFPTPFINMHLLLETQNDKRVLWLYVGNSALLKYVDHPIPDVFLHEVFATISLLFPLFDKATDKLEKELGYPFDYSTLSQRRRRRNLDSYPHFSERLAILLELSKGPTAHWWHFLVDRRNKKEHATQLIALWAFLFAFLSLLFGLISAIYGIKQYDLGIAAACAENGDHPALRGYCGG